MNLRQDIGWGVVRVILSLLLFFFAIDLLGESFQLLGISAAESIIFATSNPYIGLFIGLLITAIIQSSSTSTSMIVALVAAGSISIPDAIPMIMGANIGTTLTSTIVSLGFINKPYEFRKALSAAILHDFFNILTVIILFPLEMQYGLLSQMSVSITEWLVPSDGIINQESNIFERFSISSWFVTTINNSLILIILSFLLLFGAIKFLSDSISGLLVGNTKDLLKKYFFKNPVKAFSWGAIITAAVQSSSITTSLVVPLVAKRKVLLKNAAPFIMGANIGTTITAFIAALFNSNAALSIAIAHLLFNLTGVLFLFFIPYFRHWLIFLSSRFGKLVINYRLTGFLYILLTFFIIPFLLIYFNRESNIILHDLTYSKKVIADNSSTMVSIINKKIDDKAYDQWLIFNNGPGYERDEPNEIYNVYRRGDILLINDKSYFIGKKGFCWESKANSGQQIVCIKEILHEYQINEQLQFDSVYLFHRSIYNKNTNDSLYIHEYIDVNDKLLLIRRRYDSQKNLLIEEKLIKIEEM